MAQKIVRASDGREIKPASEEKKARKAAAAAEQVEEKAKSGRKIVQAEPTKGSSAGYRAGAIVLWILALACEFAAIMAQYGF